MRGLAEALGPLTGYETLHERLAQCSRQLTQCQAQLLSGSGGGGGVAALQKDEGLTPEMKVIFVAISIFLVLFAGMMAGLTLGLLSLDKVDLEVIKRSGTQREIWLVERVEPVLARPHYLLATLLLCNACAMEALPLFLDRLLNPVAAILLSVSAILVFGEIVPQAVCKRYGLQVGAYLSGFVRFLMLLTAGITWPIGKLLDWQLGEESALFKRRELKALVSMHAEPAEDGEQSMLTADEAQVIQGALDMASKTAESAMTPIGKVFMISSEAEINDELLLAILARGHSRLPVYEGSNKQNIVGLVLVKDLILVDEDAGVKIRDLRMRELPFMSSGTMLYDVLKVFRYGRSHMACLTQRTEEGKLEVVGVITIEDVLEELLQQEIVDETDQYVDNLQTVKTSTLDSLQQLPANLRGFLTRSLIVMAPERVAGATRSTAELGSIAATVGAAAAAAAVTSVGGPPRSPRAVAAAAATSALVAARRATALATAGSGGGGPSGRQPQLQHLSLASPDKAAAAAAAREAALEAAAADGSSAPQMGSNSSGSLAPFVSAQGKAPVPRRTFSSRTLRAKQGDASMYRQSSEALKQPLLESEQEGEEAPAPGSWHGSWHAVHAEGEAQQAQRAEQAELEEGAQQAQRRQQQIEEMLRPGQVAEQAQQAAGGQSPAKQAGPAAAAETATAADAVGSAGDSAAAVAADVAFDGSSPGQGGRPVAFKKGEVMLKSPFADSWRTEQQQQEVGRLGDGPQQEGGRKEGKHGANGDDMV